ncbi:MAG: DNA-binding transcriptional regulator Fis [Halioglobus sp.]
MNRAEPLITAIEETATDHTGLSSTALHSTGAATDTQVTTAVPKGSLRESVKSAVGQYLQELDGQMSTDVYQMVLAEMEAPLLEEIMAYTRNNQTKASLMLGLNRGTLRKKLKQYNLISEKS